MLSIRNLHAEIQGKKILKGLDLELGLGEVHAIMGPNGSGKSTLSYVLAGRPGYEVTRGEIYYKDKDLLRLSVEERAGEGVFLAFPISRRDTWSLWNELSQNRGELHEEI